MFKVNYKELSGKELNIFVDKYFKIWKKDIFKVTCLSFKDKKEYLINEHYLFKL